MKKKALFLDRDGTLIVDKHYLSNPEEIELLEGVGEFLKKAQKYGYMLFLFTNQSGIGRGYFGWEETHACNQRMIELLGLPEGAFVEIGIAPETPEEPSVYRKPSPRFILEMIEKYQLAPEGCWMIGDKISDLESGLNAGIQVAWVESPDKNKNEALERLLKDKAIPFGKNLTDLEEVIFK